MTVLGNLTDVLEKMIESVESGQQQADVPVTQVMVIFRHPSGEEGVLAQSTAPEALSRVSMARSAANLSNKMLTSMLLQHEVLPTPETAVLHAVSTSDGSFGKD